MDATFDHDFAESQVGEESRELVKEYYKRGVLQQSEGAIVADLEKYKLGVCVLLKSNGAGLYATKVCMCMLFVVCYCSLLFVIVLYCDCIVLLL